MDSGRDEVSVAWAVSASGGRINAHRLDVEMMVQIRGLEFKNCGLSLVSFSLFSVLGLQVLVSWTFIFVCGVFSN